MSAPDFDHGYLRVPISVWREVYCQAPLTRRQLQIVSAILRESWGWQRRNGAACLWTRPLPPRQLAALTGLSTDHLTRDLRALIARGVLQKREERYQFVSDPTLWKTPPTPALKARPPAPKPPAPAAETALRPLALKKAKKEYKNVPPVRESDLSPVGDNFPTGKPRANEPERAGEDRTPRGAPSGIAERLVPLIEAFVGPLAPAEARALRVWIEAEGVVPVWESLEPIFRQGRGPARAHLLQLLTASTHPEGEHA